MASNVTYSNLFSETWNNVYALVNSKTNVADPVSPVSEYRKWIYSREPDVKDVGFAGFPYIIINSVNLDEARAQSLNGKSGVVNFSVEIEVITCDREFGNRDGKGAVDNDSISNDLVETFNNAANKATLRGYGLAFSRVNSSNVDVEEFNNTLVYRRVLSLGFSSRKRISA